ncbi:MULTISPECIES: type VI secretion system-associated protein TagF [Pseudomonas]|uniref:type VI secretion system-associated protein TagF n=1 Tax=Pseudomonas TaxID=286 RepID=UPI0002D778FA|nr:MULTISPECIES: type VI secretion system-associated protein TagF [Pseudomonas]POA66618.1 type VI secretion system-associated protein TagF [Pseudomonas sp. GW531-T4]WJV25744.1 type VI secretion system-associated protein TagF [Pseudomonas chlororaphis]
MSSPGFYGKLAGRGDFIHRGLSPSFIERWDAWLSAGMATSQAALGAAWLDAYLVSPLWRFAVAPGLLGNEAVVGVMMPSVDRVGRYFPLTIALQLEAETDLGALVAGPDDWFEAAEALLLSTLEPEADVEAFEAAVPALGSPVCSVQVLCMPALEGQMRFAATTAAARGAVLLQHACEGASLWWGKGSGRVAAGLLRCQGLPAAQDFSGFLLGEGGCASLAQTVQFDFGS